MPMVWSAEADAKLMAKIIQLRGVKLNAAEMKEVAGEMGPECTPKALSHRLTHFRKLAGGGNSGVKAGNGNQDVKKATKAAKATGAVPKENGKAGGKKAPGARTPSPGFNGHGQLTPPVTDRRSKRERFKRNYAELAGEGSAAGSDNDDNGDGLNEKIKIEVGEDIGEGLRQGAEVDGEALG